MNNGKSESGKETDTGSLLLILFIGLHFKQASVFKEEQLSGG